MASGLIKNERGFYPPPNIDASMTAKEVCDSATENGHLYLWANYGSTSYAPVQKNGYWVYRLFRPAVASQNYDILEAFNLTDGEYYFYSYPKNTWYKVTSAAV